VPVRVQQSFDFSTRLQQYLSQSRLEVKNIVRSVPFVVLLLLGLFSVIASDNDKALQWSMRAGRSCWLETPDACCVRHRRI
jgi:hypothetical protein